MANEKMVAYENARAEIDELMEKLGQIQKKYDVPVQSHISENLGEIAFVKELRPDNEFYGDVYDQYGLFGRDYENNKDHYFGTNHRFT